jgi:hypothetical protein
MGVMSDDKLDRFIDEAAKEYNRPSARVPREEMWARIERERRRPREPGGSPAATPITPRRRRAQWIAVAGAIAAALVIGIVLGREWRREPAPTLTAENRPTPPAGGLEVQQPAGAPAPDVALPVEQRVAADVPRAGLAPGARDAPDARDARDVSREPEAAGGRSTVAYEVATMNHLAQMEALLTTFRATNRDGRVDAQLSVWARDMLSTTRLLLDSPAAEEGRNRRLLEDLELVLVQIVNLSPSAGVSDRGSIERTLENGQVMTRLRTAVPAGGLPTGT